MNRNRPTHHKKQRGLGMIEVLITVVILAIGLLGVTGLQLTSLRSNQIAQLRTHVTWLAYDISDRMRANMQGVEDGNYNDPDPIQMPACLTIAGCSVAEMAQHDTYEWTQSLQATLPEGTGLVCLDSTPDDGTPTDPECDGGGGEVYVIKIWWDDNRDGNLDRFEMSFQP